MTAEENVFLPPSECGEFEVPKIRMASTFRNFKFEKHTRINRLLVWL